MMITINRTEQTFLKILMICTVFYILLQIIASMTSLPFTDRPFEQDVNGDYEYQGCFRDNLNDRAFLKHHFNENDPEFVSLQECANRAMGTGSRFFGMQSFELEPNEQKRGKTGLCFSDDIYNYNKTTRYGHSSDCYDVLGTNGEYIGKTGSNAIYAIV